jgi:hypothetical protein
MIKQAQLEEVFSDWKKENINIKSSDDVIKSVKVLDKDKYFSDEFTLYDVDYLAVDFKSNPIFPGNSYSLSFILIIQKFGNSNKIVGIDQI